MAMCALPTVRMKKKALSGAMQRYEAKLRDESAHHAEFSYQRWSHLRPRLSAHAALPPIIRDGVPHLKPGAGSNDPSPS